MRYMLQGKCTMQNIPAISYTEEIQLFQQLPGTHKAAFEPHTPISGKGEGADVAIPVQHMVVVLVATLESAWTIAEEGAPDGSRNASLNIVYPVVILKVL